MTAALDNLTSTVGTLETTSAQVVTQIASLQAGSDDAALTALAGRVSAVTTSLAAAIAVAPTPTPIAPPAQ